MPEPTIIEPAASAVAVIAQAPAVSTAVITVPSAADQATTVVTSAGAAFTPNAFIIEVFGRHVNMMSVLILMIIAGLLLMFFKIQVSKKLDFADMITFDGRKVSLTKVLQLIGGLAGTWVIIKTAAVGTLSSEIFGIYLTYVGAIEGYSKYVAAKYGYSETSVKDGGGNVTSSDALSVLKAAAVSAADAEQSAREAKVSVKNASADLNSKED